MTTDEAPVSQAGPRGSRDVTPVERHRDPRDLLAQIFSTYGLIVVWVVLIGVFGVLNGEVFLTTLTAQTIGSTKAVVALLALAALVPLVVGQFDLSVTAQFGLAQALGAGLIVHAAEVSFSR